MSLSNNSILFANNLALQDTTYAQTNLIEVHSFQGLNICEYFCSKYPIDKIYTNFDKSKSVIGRLDSTMCVNIFVLKKK